LEDEGRPRKRADETASKAAESRVYIEVNVKTSNEHCILITGMWLITLLISDV